MGYLKFARYAISGLLLAATATAQSRPGVSFDQTTSTVTMTAAGIDSSINLMRITSAGADIRADLEKGNFARSIGPFSAGPHAVMIVRGGGAQIAFLNPDEKQYLSMKPLEMMQGAQKMMEGMGGSMTFDTSVTRITLDSVGPGPAIDGHPTLTYRLTTVMKLTVSMMGQQNVVTDQATTEIQSATDMGDLNQVNSFSELAQSMGFMKGFFDKVVATRQKIRGFPLRSVKHSTGSANGQSRTSIETVETRNVKHLTVPDSLFSIPVDYKPVSLPGMPGTGM